MGIAREEIFGPLVGILRADDEPHALELANDSSFGLSSAVFTTNTERGVQFARGIKVGMTHVNDIPVNDEAHVAFGGEKSSGLGSLRRGMGHRGIHHRPMGQRAARTPSIPLLVLCLVID